MTSKVLALPVTIEQIANTIKQMSHEERLRLLELVPELTQNEPTISIEEAKANVAKLEVELKEALGGQIFSLDDPFLGNLTLGQYLALPDEEQGRLWDELAGDNWFDELEEVDVQPNALPVG